ncbi:MAG: C40 family peptidase [Elusimicrobia bacterium]|nr:C40 family peptidase [Elusimicrobiota bacterium]
MKRRNTVLILALFAAALLLPLIVYLWGTHDRDSMDIRLSPGISFRIPAIKRLQPGSQAPADQASQTGGGISVSTETVTAGGTEPASGPDEKTEKAAKLAADGSSQGQGPAAGPGFLPLGKETAGLGDAGRPPGENPDAKRPRSGAAGTSGKASGQGKLTPEAEALFKAFEAQVAGSDAPELANLAKVFMRYGPEEAMARAQKALAISKRLDSIGENISKRDEDYNLARIAHQRAAQAKDGSSAALRRQASALEKQLNSLSAEKARAMQQLQNLIGPVPAAAPQKPPAGLNHASPGARIAVETAYAQLGKRYIWGEDGPNTFDCSGLVMYSWSKAGVAMPHSSRLQSRTFPAVPKSALMPGDLVFFGNPVHHVGMYVGGGQMVHAAGRNYGVIKGSVNRSDYAGADRPQPRR